MTDNIGTFGEYGQPDFRMEEEATPESQHPVLVQLNKKIEDLQNLLADKEATVLRLRDKYRTAEYKVEAELKELLDEEVIDFEQAKAIADIFDNITLTKQIEIEYKITATATVEVPYNFDSDSVADEIYCDRVDFSTYNSDFEVLETDYDVEDWTVRS